MAASPPLCWVLGSAPPRPHKAQYEGGLVQQEIQDGRGWTPRHWNHDVTVVPYLKAEGESETWDILCQVKVLELSRERFLAQGSSVVPGGVVSSFFSIRDTHKIPRRHWVMGVGLSPEPHPLSHEGKPHRRTPSATCDIQAAPGSPRPWGLLTPLPRPSAPPPAWNIAEQHLMGLSSQVTVLLLG